MPAGVPGSPAASIRVSLSGRIAEVLEAERDRWFYWAPVMVGAGIGLYFGLPAEPHLGVALLPLVLALVLRATLPRGVIVSLVVGALLASTLGLAVARIRTEMVRAPVLERPMTAVAVAGWVELVEPRPVRGERLTIRVASLGTLAPVVRPHRVRIRMMKAMPGIRPGDAIRVRASLVAPAGPPIPGGYDFARQAYFQRIGAVGYAMSAAEPDATLGPPPPALRWAARIERVRQAIGARIVAILPGETGAIANALITGERGGISEAANQAYRDSGLFHVLSISGLHMTVMAGATFFLVRLLLTLSPALALNQPIKKWAAVIASLAAFGYLLISGSSSATVRSYLMITVMFLAVLLDRPGIALRNVAIAALIILLLAPETLHDVGFQMSFAAVVALVAVFEAIRERNSRRDRSGFWAPLMTALLMLGAIVLTTLIASLSVAPFAAYHFHKSQQYAILANLIAIPICNIVVMPAALATLIVLPLGLEALPLMVMGLGIEAMSWCARVVAALPGSVGSIPAIPASAFAMMVVGGLWLLLWRGRWRLWGLAGIAAGVALAPTASRPDLLIGRDGTLVAARLDGGRLSALSGRGSQYELGRWLEFDGDARPGRSVAKGAGYRCDSLGCVASLKGRVLALPSHPAALVDDCAKADLLVLRWPKPGGCHARGTVIDFFAVRDGGVHAVSVAGDRVVVETVAAARGVRPWTGRVPAAAAVLATAGASRLGAFAAPFDLTEPEAAGRSELDEEAGGG